MFSKKRRWLAAAGLMAALSLAAPTPTLAAGLWASPADVSGLVSRAWPWLERLGLVHRASKKPVTAVWEHEGVMIDPDGAPAPTNPVPASTMTAETKPNPAGGW
ncbi:MAG TPA: hypothetical protein VF789_17530 [Thermoanaerobaculia bacterium]